MDGSPNRYLVIKGGNVAVFKPNATVGSGMTYKCFLISAMEVNIPEISVFEAWFGAFKAEDAAQDKVFGSLFVGRPQPLGLATLEDGVLGGVGSVLFADAETAKRGAVGTFFGAEPEFGCGGGECQEELSVMIEPDLLVRDGDVK